MRVPPLVSDFFDWRWAPCVGLTAGSLAFVGLAILLIPAQFGAAPRSDSQLSFDRPSAPPQRALFGASLARTSLPGFGQRPSDEASPPPPPAPAVNDPTPPPPRGFSPVAERAEPPPPPPPPVLEVPPPVPAALIPPPPDPNLPAPAVQ